MLYGPGSGSGGRVAAGVTTFTVEALFAASMLADGDLELDASTLGLTEGDDERGDVLDASPFPRRRFPFKADGEFPIGGVGLFRLAFVAISLFREAGVMPPKTSCH